MILIYLIDGYNLLFSKYNAHPAEGLEQKRELLIKYVKNIFGANAIFVFDGKFGMGTYANKHVIFTKSMSADNYIKKYVEKQKNRELICVVTDDREIRDYVKSLGAKVMWTSDFIRLKPAKKRSKKKFEQEVNEYLKKQWHIEE